MTDDIVLDCIHFRRVDGQWWDCDEGSEPYLLVMTGAMVAALDEIERLRGMAQHALTLIPSADPGDEPWYSQSQVEAYEEALTEIANG